MVKDKETFFPRKRKSFLQLEPTAFIGNIVFIGDFFPFSSSNIVVSPSKAYIVFLLTFHKELLSFLPWAPLPRSDKVMSGNVLRGAIDFPSNLSSLFATWAGGSHRHTITNSLFVEEKKKKRFEHYTSIILSECHIVGFILSTFKTKYDKLKKKCWMEMANTFWGFFPHY